MRYMGGKAKIAKELTKFLNSQLEPNQSFVDAFCGSLNITRYINSDRLRLANDINDKLISLWVYLQNGGLLPESITEEEYNKIKDNKEKHPDWLVAFVGFGCSFGGKYFGGYAGDNKKTRDYIKEAVRSCYAKAKDIKDVVFISKSYYDLEIPEKSMIYCDIPYRNTTGYVAVGDNFNHDKFYQWAIQKHKEGHKIFVSEYGHNILDGWKIVWSKEPKTGLKDSNGKCIVTKEVIIIPN